MAGGGGEGTGAVGRESGPAVDVCVWIAERFSLFCGRTILPLSTAAPRDLRRGRDGEFEGGHRFTSFGRGAGVLLAVHDFNNLVGAGIVADPRECRCGRALFFRRWGMACWLPIVVRLLFCCW